MARSSEEKPKFRLPEGYADEAEFLEEMRQEIGEDEAAEDANHKAGVEDLQFLTGDQWDQDVKAKRIAALKPVLTINRLPAFVAQVIGQRKQQETTIKVVPDRGGTKPEAKVREGLVRSIQKVSRAAGAYDTALLGSVTAGIGNFQLVTDYESDDVWDQCMAVAGIPDHFSVIWDRLTTDPSGRDADHCAVVDRIPWRQFEQMYPWATPGDVATNRFPAETLQANWFTHNDVRIVDWWKVRTRRRVLALMRDGSTKDITETEDDPDTIAQIVQRPDGSPFIRDVMRKYVQRYKCSGLDILEGPYELPIDRVPIFRVPGWEIRIGDTTHRWGLIRFMKDPQRLHNYWRSAIAEKIMRSPKQSWIAADNAVAGREALWRNSHLSDDPLLIWNSESGHRPERVDPIQVEGALIEQVSITTQDLKDVSNIHEANLGMPSNEVSGVAIRNRQQVSQTGTLLYFDNLELAMEECGRVMNDMIPLIYDAPRIIQIIGDDDQELMQAINDTSRDGSINITATKYRVSAVTGRSTKTKREESASEMLDLATAMPETLSVAADLIVSAMDWPDADKLAQRLKRSIPPQLLGPDELTPEMQQQLQAQSQQDAQNQQINTAGATAKILKDRADAQLSAARSQNYLQQANAIAPKLQNETLRTASEVASRELHDNLAAIETATGA